MTELKFKPIKYNIRGIILNTGDAETMSLREGDRIRIVDEKTGKYAVSFMLSVSDDTNAGEFAAYPAINPEFTAERGHAYSIFPAERPKSVDCIRKKMDGFKLESEELRTIINDILSGTLTQGEISAFVSAVYIRGLDMDETENLTRAMIDTGSKLSFSKHPVVDKHSIGGVPGNKISLLVVPIIAAGGLIIPKTSSRAVTGAGGTADLMEALCPVCFSGAEIEKMADKTGGVIVWGGSTNIAPADDIIIRHEYPLKIDGRSQMIASVMAKKIACGADLIVIDIPAGPEAKVKDIEDGKELARQFIELGKRFGVKVECAVTYGDAPVGRAIGVNLENREAFLALEGKSGAPDSLIQKSLSIAGIAFEMAGIADKNRGYEYAKEILTSGKALAKLKEIISIQGGNPDVTSNDIKPGKFSHSITSVIDGYVTGMKNRGLITIARTAGAPSDHGAGILIHKKRGQRVEKGEKIFTIYADNELKLNMAVREAREMMPITVTGMMMERVGPDDWRIS